MSRFNRQVFSCVCCIVHPFQAVYAYTPSKLPSSVATPRPTPELNGYLETAPVTKVVPSLSLSAPDAGTSGNGCLDNLELAACAREPSSVINGEGIETMVVYSRRAEVVNGSAALHEDGNGLRCFTQSGIRRSCSLDGVALASRRHDDDVIYQRGGVARTSSESSDEGSHSQGDVRRVFSVLSLTTFCCSCSKQFVCDADVCLFDTLNFVE